MRAACAAMLTLILAACDLKSESTVSAEVTANQNSGKRASSLSSGEKILRRHDDAISADILNCKSKALKSLEKDHFSAMLSADTNNSLIKFREQTQSDLNLIKVNPKAIGIDEVSFPFEACTFDNQFGERIVLRFYASCTFKQGKLTGFNLGGAGVPVPAGSVHTCDGLDL